MINIVANISVIGRKKLPNNRNKFIEYNNNSFEKEWKINLTKYSNIKLKENQTIGSFRRLSPVYVL